MDYKTNVIELKKIMLDKGYTAKTLSDDSELNYRTVLNILNGTHQPSANSMRKLVAVLEIPPHEAGEIFFFKN